MQHKNRHPIFRQIVVYTTLRQSETMWHTGVFHIVERQAEEANAAISRKRFSSKVISCNATTERDDELYLSYCSLSSDEARTQMMTFHGKDFLSKVVLCNAQRKLPGQVVLIVLPVRAVERAAAECCFSQKNYSQYDASTVPFGASGTLAKKVIPVSVSISATVISCGTAEAVCSTQ